MKSVRGCMLGGFMVLTVVASAWAQGKPTPIEGYVPSGPILYVYYQGLTGAEKGFEGTALKRIIAEPEVQEFGKELSRFIDEAMKLAPEGMPITWPDVRMLLDCEMGFALLDVRAQMPQMMLVIRGGAHVAGIRALIDRLIARIMPPDQPVPEGEMDGIAFKQVGPFHISWVGADLVIASGPGTMRRVVRTLKGFDPSLAQDVRFKTVRAKTMGGKEFLMVHFDAEKLIEQKLPPGENAPPRPKWFKAAGAEEVSSVHFSLAPDAPGVKSMVYVHAPRGRRGLLRMVPIKPLDEKKVLSGISAEVSGFAAVRCSLVDLYDALQQMLVDVGKEQEFNQDMEQLKRKLGFDLRADLLGALGDELLIQPIGPGYLMLPEFYVSAGVKDEAGLRRCLDKLLAVAAEEIEKQAAAAPPGGVPRRGPALEVEKLHYKGQEIVAVKIRAAPFPVTPSFAVTKGRLLVALVPQTVKKALDLQRAPRRPIAESSTFAALRAHLAKNPSILGYSEFKQGFEGAYSGLLTHLVQMLNGIPQLPPHSLGTRFPSSNAIVPHLFGTVEAASYDGEGLLFESYGPFGGGMGPPAGGGGGGSVATMGIMAGFLLPALAKSQEAARRASCMNNVRQIGLAMIQYAGDHDDKFPESLGELLQMGYLTTPRVFICPSGKERIPPGFPQDLKNADLAVLNQVEQFGSYVMVKGITHAAPADFIILHDKDGAHRGEGRNCFHNDGHTRWYSEAGFQQKMKEQREKMGKPVLR